MKLLKKNNQGWYGKMKRKQWWSRMSVERVDYNTLRLKGYSHHQARKIVRANLFEH